MRSLSLALMSATALMVAGGFAHPSDFAPVPKKSKPEWKPLFTSEELQELRSLPKKEREAKVKELREKYLKVMGDPD